jgi:hypothetical protein
MIVAADTVIDRVGGMKLEILFEVSLAKCRELRHVGELSASRLRCNFAELLCGLCVSYGLNLRKTTTGGAEDAENR